MPNSRSVMPFTALVGQDAMKTALVLNAINPGIGGVLIRGQRGTAKSTAVRALARLLPEIDVIAGCRYRCDPEAPATWCDDCRARADAGIAPVVERRRMRVVELPVNASEDRVVGTIDTEAAIKLGERRFEPGLLADANRGILYVDEVNLLDDHIVDVLLDAAAMGWNVVEREGISFSHPSRFILVGTMNPEEGDLRPQLLDRFGLCVDITGLRDVDERVRIMERDSRRNQDGVALESEFLASEDHLKAVIQEAKRLLPRVEIPPTIGWFIALVCIDAGALGHRADIVVSSAARTARAWEEAEKLVRARSRRTAGPSCRPPGGYHRGRHHRGRAGPRAPEAQPPGRRVAARGSCGRTGQGAVRGDRPGGRGCGRVRADRGSRATSLRTTPAVARRGRARGRCRGATRPPRR